METKKFVMNSTFYPPYHIGGDAVHVKLLSEELVRRGHEVHVIHLLDSYYVQKLNVINKSESENVNDNGVWVHRIKSDWGAISALKNYSLGGSFEILKKIRSAIDVIKPNVIHHHNIAGFGSKILNYKAEQILYTAHDYWSICPMNDFMYLGKKTCDTKLPFCPLCSSYRKKPVQFWRPISRNPVDLLNVDVVVAPSKYLATQLINNGIEKPIVVMRNFIPPSTHTIQKKDSDYFLYVGVLETHKGILELIKIFNKNIDSIEKKLKIIGDGSKKQEILKFIKKNKLENKIILTGSIDRNSLFSEYSNACALIIPSICNENNPLVALESMSCGTPIITSDRGGLPEITGLIDEKLIFHNYDELNNLLKNFNIEKIDKNKITTTFFENFTPNIYINKYIKLLNH